MKIADIFYIMQIIEDSVKKRSSKIMREVEEWPWGPTVVTQRNGLSGFRPGLTQISPRIWEMVNPAKVSSGFVSLLTRLLPLARSRDSAWSPLLWPEKRAVEFSGRASWDKPGNLGGGQPYYADLAVYFTADPPPTSLSLRSGPPSLLFAVPFVSFYW